MEDISAYLQKAFSQLDPQLVLIIVTECSTGSRLNSVVDIDKALDQLQQLADEIPDPPTPPNTSSPGVAAIDAAAPRAPLALPPASSLPAQTREVANSPASTGDAA